ncbi:ATP-binding protein [Paenibacillus sp. PsM32]|uniref:AFG1/ZapE family ATPase n=1 Tax=unclassified Paenibacillus TaxID=185978 RepID=UPI0023670C14|nr:MULTISPECIES: AFG1/ZapE family ATPase [unclassified Paenibacillus]MDN4617630.1 ATP-binding protein [Paenibacillus sp. PsM32]WDF52914.1 ATP-binding protein [Paenibacillus sp. KACC 21273]
MGTEGNFIQQLMQHKFKEHTDQVVGDHKHCDHCPGLSRCPLDFSGHFTKLYVHDTDAGLKLYARKAPCKKQFSFRHNENVKKRISSYFIDMDLLESAFDAVEIVKREPQLTLAVREIMEYVNSVKSNKESLPINGLYLQGPFGTGKTFLMSYLLYEMAKQGYTDVIVYIPEFIEDLKMMMTDNTKLRQTIQALKDTDFLVFDDIGAEALNPWARDHILGAILNQRMNKKPTFYTSNYVLSDLLKHLSFTNKEGESKR